MGETQTVATAQPQDFTQPITPTELFFFMLFKIYCVLLHSFPTLYPSCSEHSHQLKKTHILQTLCTSLDTIKSYHSFTVTPTEKLDSKIIKTFHYQHFFKTGNNMIPELLCPTTLIVNTFSNLHYI